MTQFSRETTSTGRYLGLEILEGIAPLAPSVHLHHHPVTTETDEVLAILSRDPMMTVGLEGSGELAFRHQVQLTDVNMNGHNNRARHHHQDTGMKRHHHAGVA